MNERTSRGLIIATVVLIVGIVAGIYFARGFRPKENSPVVSTDLPIRTDILMKRNQLIGRDEQGKISWSVWADRIETDRMQSQVDFSGKVEATLYDGDGSETKRAIFNAPHVLYTESNRVLQADGKLTCRLLSHKKDGSEIRVGTDMLYWNVGGKTIVCPNLVHADIPGGFVEGKRLEADLRTHAYTLGKGRGQLAIDMEASHPLQNLEGFTR